MNKLAVNGGENLFAKTTACNFAGSGLCVAIVFHSILINLFPILVNSGKSRKSFLHGKKKFFKLYNPQHYNIL